MESIPFIDLKTQYVQLKEEINGRIQRVLDHGGFIMGPEIQELETQLSQWVGSKHTLSVSSGTDAALLAMMALPIQPGDEVILPAFSFIATAETVLLARGTPVYVDIDPITYNISPKAIKAAITPKTKAIVPVGLYGQPPDMDEINAIAKEHKLIVIEDAAQSFGAKYKNKRSGTLGDIGVTSFFPAKPLGCYGDGGAIFTDNPTWAKQMSNDRNHGQEKRYHHTSIGINGRMDTLQAAILIPKLGIFEHEIAERNRIANRYTEMLKPLFKNDERFVLPVISSNRESSWAQYTIRAPRRDEFAQKLNALGCPTSVHYPSCMCDQPAYKGIGRTLDVTESRKAALEVLSLPMSAYLKESHQERIVDAIGKTMKGF